MYLFLPSALHNSNTPSKNAWVDLLFQNPCLLAILTLDSGIIV